VRLCIEHRPQAFLPHDPGANSAFYVNNNQVFSSVISGWIPEQNPFHAVKTEGSEMRRTVPFSGF
jgi:hypothetical protein